MNPEQAANAIAELFPSDGGRAVLSEGELPESWTFVTAAVPSTLFQSVRDGIGALLALRNHWSQTKRLRPAIAATRAILRLRIAQLGPDHPDTLVEVGALGALALRAGKMREAGDLLTQAYEGLRPMGGKDIRLAVVAGNIARYWLARDDIDKALDALDQGYRVRQRVAPETTGRVAAQIGELLLRKGKSEEALDFLREAWVTHLRQMGPTHPKTLARAQTLGVVLNKHKLFREAAPVLRDVHVAVGKTGPPDRLALVGFELGVALHNSNRKEEGLRLIEESIRYTRDAGTIDEPHPSLPNRLHTWAQIQLERRRPAEFEGLMREALEAETKLFGPNSDAVAGRYAALGYYCARTGRIHEALGWLDPAASIMRSALGDDHPKTHKVVAVLIELLIEQGMAAVEARDKHLAAELIARANELARPVLGHGSREMAELRKLEGAFSRLR